MRSFKKDFIVFMAITSFLLFGLAQPVFGISQEQRRLFDSGVLNFNIEVAEPTVCGGTTSTLTGSENAEKIFNFLTGKGLSAVQAAGIMGNLQAESHFEPRLVQYGKLNSRGEISVAGKPSSLDDTMLINGSSGYGLAQWTDKGRQEKLHAAMVAAGKTVDSDLGVQLEFLWTEMAGLEQQIRALTDIAAVTSLFMLKFERPKDQSPAAQAERAKLSRDILAKYGSGVSTGTASDTVTCAGGGSGEVVGGFSLPVDKTWYDKHKDWFTKPHDRYPAADIPVPENTPIYSMTAGTVKVPSAGGDCGKGVVVDAGNGFVFTYCHGSDGGTVTGAKAGDKVNPGQLIMHSSYTGRVFPAGPAGTHLHLQIEKNGQNLCPQTLFVGIVEGNIPGLGSLPTSGCIR